MGNYYIDPNKNYIIREVKLSDAKDIYKFAKLEIVTKFLNWQHHKSLRETEFVIKNYFLKKDKYPNSYAIVDVKNNVVIGIIDFLDGQIGTNDYPNIGYFLNPNYWGQGIMANALNTLLSIGFNELNYKTIGISHIIGNNGSRRVIEKNNFKYVKTLENINMGKHNNVNVKYYEISRSDYNANK